MNKIHLFKFRQSARLANTFWDSNYLDCIYSLVELQPYSVYLCACTFSAGTLNLQGATVMADISKTEKVQLHAPDLEELRGGKDFFSFGM